MFPPLLLLLLLLPLLSTCCRLEEFPCDNGRCVPSGRYCDGNDDCGDLSDEPTACTNCNRTYYAEANVKHPLRMSSPYQRPLPFVCSMTFVAAGGQYGDRVQLTFLSFQIGALEMNNDSNPTCLKGYLQIVEPPPLTNALLSQQTRGFDQILSALKQPTEQLSSLFDTSRGNPEFGRLCGDMIGKSATFYTEGNNVTIKVVIPGKAALHPFSFSVYLTFKYLPKDASPNGSLGQQQSPELQQKFLPNDLVGQQLPVHQQKTEIRQQSPNRKFSLNAQGQQQPQQQMELQQEHRLTTGTSYYYGNKLTNTYCDRVLVNCDRKRCAIRSPNFPGFYLRNITCHYWIRQEYVPHGRHANIVLTQTNEYKISLYTGRSSPLSYPHVSLTEECHSDVIRVFDGPGTSSPLLTEFCGAGTLTEVVSSSPEILVQLHSVPSQVMHNSYAEIEVDVRFTDLDDFRTDRDGRCDFQVDGSVRRSGLIYSPRHTVPRNTTCSFRFRGATPLDRIWLYFLSYFVEDRHPWSRREICEVGRLEIYEPHIYGQSLRKRKDAAALLVTGDLDEDEEENDDKMVFRSGSKEHHHLQQEPSYRFCEKTLPKVCARAADSLPNYVPVRPCKVPDESYLSRGPGLVLKHNAYATPELSTWSSSFTLRYEFVDMRQQGEQASSRTDGDGHSPCDRRFDRQRTTATTDRLGSVTSPKNVFLFGRGGSRNISCTYEFLGLPDERIILTFTDIRLKGFVDCEHQYDPVVQRHNCRRQRTGVGGAVNYYSSASLTVVERTSEHVFSPLACFCNFKSEPRRPLVIESVTRHVTVSFDVTDMSPFDDFESFGFEAVYEFVPITPCEASIDRKNGSSEGEVTFRVPSTVEGRAMPLRCRWLLEAGAPHKYLYLRFKGTDADEYCPPTGNKIIVYSSLPTPLSVVCLGTRGGSTSVIRGAESAAASGIEESSPGNGEVDVFSAYWYNESAGARLLRDHVYIEVLASHAETVRFRWMEVTKRQQKPRQGLKAEDPCPFECPELDACIGAELWCDGRKHCPSGYDEAPAHCERFPTPYVVAGASVGVIALLTLLGLVSVRCRRRSDFKESRPVPTEDFPMDSPHV